MQLSFGKRQAYCENAAEKSSAFAETDQKGLI